MNLSALIFLSPLISLVLCFISIFHTFFSQHVVFIQLLKMIVLEVMCYCGGSTNTTPIMILPLLPWRSLNLF